MDTRQTLIELRKLATLGNTPDVSDGLASFFQTNLPNDKPRYTWAFPKAQTTDEAVAAFIAASDAALAKAKKIPGREFDPCLFFDHLSKASALLDRCLARRDQIYALEGTALTSALDYLLAATTELSELELAKVALKAQRKQATATDKDADESALGFVFDARSQSREARLLLHKQPGNPLNYAERINELRDLLADDIRSVRELLMAARLGLHQSGLAPDLEPIGDWDGAKTDNLLTLIKWCRGTIRAMEINQRREIVYKRAFYLSGDRLIDAKRFADAIATKNEATPLTFELRSHHFANGTENHRILQLGVAAALDDGVFRNLDDDDTRTRNLYEDAWQLRDRKRFSLSVLVTLPLQKAEFKKAKSTDWTRQRIDMDQEVQHWDSIYTQAFPASSGAQVRNSNPVGPWEITLGQFYRTASGEFPRIDLVGDNMYQTPKFRLRDIVVYMTVASLTT